MKQLIFNHLKNIPGWRTNRKLVAIAVDDYGNVRLHSKKAREQMDKAGLKVHSRFDAYDTLETREDLEALYEVLESVKDKNGKPAVFTPFALPCNINFEEIKENGYSDYVYELLPETYNKLAAMQPKDYEGAWELWQEGISRGLMVPQFHGREHLNLKVFREKMANRDFELLTALENRSYTSLSSSGYKTIGYTAAFQFWEFEENYDFREIIRSGLEQFEKVYGYKSIHFNPPGGREHPIIHKYLKECSVKYIDGSIFNRLHLGKGKFKNVFSYTGKMSEHGLLMQVRNVVFEPTDDRGVDPVAYALDQVSTAFFWNRPAIISSHRVNFCGHINKNNRLKGLKALKELLSTIVKRWPEVEFISTAELGDLMNNNES